MTEFINSGLEGLTTVRTSQDVYQASDGDLVITDGSTVELPTPTQGATVIVKQLGSIVSLETPEGSIAQQSNKARYEGDDGLYLVADNSNWYVRSDLRDVVADIPDAVVTQWRYEDDSDTSTAVDSVGSNDGSINGASYDGNGRCGSFALAFDGADDSVISQSTADLAADGPTDGVAVGGFFRGGDSGDTEYAVGWEVDNNNLLFAYVAGGTWNAFLQVDGTNAIADSGVAANGNNYQHVIAAADGSDVWIIIDGTEEGRESHSLDPTNIGAGDLVVGDRLNAGSGNYGGLTDNSSFANAGLTESDAQTLIDQC